MELWDDEEFNFVGSALGNPLLTDTLTENRKRTSYARIYVEIDTKCKYPNNVIVVVDDSKAYKLLVEYNWRLSKCDVCEVFGHTKEIFVKNKNTNTTTMWLQKEEGIATSTGNDINMQRNVNIEC